ncbi:MAG: hypothetical protein JO264_10945 [Acidisphaera sp.]|nr:hypothetical protein [Acidisphaera sp.]
MKVTIAVDCTPDEARQFLGLPDVKPMQEAVMARVERQMLEAADALSPDAVMKSWLSLVPQSADQFQEVFTKLFKAPFGGGSRESKAPEPG